MAEKKAKAEQAETLKRQYRVRGGRAYVTTVEVDGRQKRVTYRGGAKLWLTPEEGDAASEHLIPAEEYGG